MDTGIHFNFMEGKSEITFLGRGVREENNLFEKGGI